MNGNGSNGNGTTREIVAKLWSLCHVLRDDGVSYGEYVTELTFLLFVKMLAETGHEERLPKAYRWEALARREGLDQLEHYRQLLLDLGNPAKTKDALVLAIFTDAQTKLRKPTNLKTLTDAIDKLDWFSAREEGLGNLYEGLLEKNAAEKKSGAGQYFTPRPLIDCIVRLVKPQPGEVVQDPAAGTAGFLVAADRYIKDKTDDLYKLSEAKAFFQRHNAFVGIELVPDTHRLCLMNLMLHGIESQVESGDSLSPDGERLGKADVILTNPPFGTKKGGGRPTRADFSITADTSNKQLAFVEHVVRALKPGGRAAIVVPDNVLFEDGVGRRLRFWMMELCNVHTILRLPTGIFYANELRLDQIEEIGVTPAEAERVRLRAGDLLIVEGNGSVDQIGRVALWQEEVANCGHQNHIIRASPLRGIVPKFVLYWLLSPAGRAAIELVASSSSGLHTLSISKVRGLPVPLCSEAEMVVVVEEIERRLIVLDATFEQFSRAISLLDRLDQALLAKAFRGELVDQCSAPSAVIFAKPDLMERKRGSRVV